MAEIQAMILCRASYVPTIGKRGRKGRQHICGRKKGHKGAHSCYCGQSWARRKSQRACIRWHEAAFPASRAEPARQVPQEIINELYGPRYMEG